MSKMVYVSVGGGGRAAHRFPLDDELFDFCAMCHWDACLAVFFEVCFRDIWKDLGVSHIRGETFLVGEVSFSYWIITPCLVRGIVRVIGTGFKYGRFMIHEE